MQDEPKPKFRRRHPPPNAGGLHFESMWGQVAVWLISMITHQPFGLIVMIGLIYAAFGREVAFQLLTICVSVGLAYAALETKYRGQNGSTRSKEDRS